LCLVRADEKLGTITSTGRRWIPRALNLLTRPLPSQQEGPMPRRGTVKNRRQYEGLRRKGMSKQRAAKITNAGKAGSRKGGRKAGRRRKSSR
jgi:hypothetical protein